MSKAREERRTILAFNEALDKWFYSGLVQIFLCCGGPEDFRKGVPMHGTVLVSVRTVNTLANTVVFVDDCACDRSCRWLFWWVYR